MGLGLSLEKLIMLRKEFQKAGATPLPAPRTGQPKLWSSGVSLGSLPATQLIPVLSEKQEAEESWRGRWQDPDQILRTLPSLRCHGNAAIFISLFMMLKALTFSVPERPGWLCPHPSMQHLPPEAWGGKGVVEGRGTPGAPLHQGTV